MHLRALRASRLRALCAFVPYASYQRALCPLFVRLSSMVIKGFGTFFFLTNTKNNKIVNILKNTPQNVVYSLLKKEKYNLCIRGQFLLCS